MALLSIILWILYAIIRKSPGRWWLYYWLISLPILVFLVFLTPLVFEPMFNRFVPLAETQPQLIPALNQVMHRGGLEIPSSRMFEMKASEKVTKEHEADIYGLEVIHGIVAHSSKVAASAFQKLGEKSLDYPFPAKLYVFWAYSHPPITDRLRFALGYHPWDSGEIPRFIRDAK